MEDNAIQQLNDSEFNSAVGAWRDGELLVVRNGATLPKPCPKCNAEAIESPIKLKIVRPQGEGFIGAAVADAIDQYKGSTYVGPIHVRVFFCPRHRRLRRVLLIICLACIVLGAGGAAVCLLIDPKDGLSGAVFFPVVVALGGFAGILATLNGENPWFKPKRFNQEYVWLKGACVKYLNNLPRFIR